MVKQVWLATDMSVHETQAEAENHDLVVKVAARIYDAYLTHNTGGAFKYINQNDAMRVADVLVNTDVFSSLRDLLDDINPSDELKQLRRIDKAARVWFASRSARSLDDLAETLFDGQR